MSDHYTDYITDSDYITDYITDLRLFRDYFRPLYWLHWLPPTRLPTTLLT